MQIGKYRLEGGGMCPEQYDVFDGEKEVGYLRLRHGSFAAYLTGRGTDWDAVYQSDEMEGDGCFEDDEREKFLTAAVNAIDAALCPNAALCHGDEPPGASASPKIVNGSSPWHQQVVLENDNMKTLKELNRKLEKARATVKALDTAKKKLIRRETVVRLARAQKKAKYRIGDILTYSDNPPILVTYIGCYDSGEPWYGGLQIVNGKLTRNRRRTEGWGQQDTTKDRDGRKYPSSWKKVGDCSMLLFQNAELSGAAVSATPKTKETL